MHTHRVAEGSSTSYSISLVFGKRPTHIHLNSLRHICRYAMKVTLQTIADQVGVTRATVSMALRNDPQISQARREEIQKVAEALGYRPNPMVASLMSHLRESKPPPQRTGLLYLVSGESPSAGPWPGHPFDLYFRGAAERAARHGFRLERFWIREPGLTEARIEKILKTRKIPGVIIGPKEDALPLPRLPWEQLAAVMIGHSYREPQFDHVYTNYYASTRLAMDFIQGELHPPVRMILPEQHDQNVRYLWRGRYLQKRMGQKHFKPPLVVNSPKRAVEWVQRNPGCTVLGTNLVLTWLQEANLREYMDFRFVSLNVEGRTELTGVLEPSWEIGTEAADMVISRVLLNRKGIPPKSHITLIVPEWQQGAWKESPE